MLESVEPYVTSLCCISVLLRVNQAGSDGGQRHGKHRSDPRSHNPGSLCEHDIIIV